MNDNYLKKMVEIETKFNRKSFYRRLWEEILSNPLVLIVFIQISFLIFLILEAKK